MDSWNKSPNNFFIIFLYNYLVINNFITIDLSAEELRSYKALKKLFLKKL